MAASARSTALAEPEAVDRDARRDAPNLPLSWRDRARADHLASCCHFGAEDGGQARGSDNRPAGPRRPRLAASGGLSPEPDPPDLPPRECGAAIRIQTLGPMPTSFCVVRFTRARQRR